RNLCANRVAGAARRTYFLAMPQASKGFGFAIFPTALGACAIVWSADGIVGVRLPERSESATRARIAVRYPDAREASPPANVQRVIADIVALLAGEVRDFSDAPLDLRDVPEFHRRVYDIARTIPAGRTMTYGEVATRLGDRLMAREVGQALGKNPVPVIVPCH